MVYCTWLLSKGRLEWWLALGKAGARGGCVAASWQPMLRGAGLQAASVGDKLW